MGDHADDAIHAGIDQGWGYPYVRRFRPSRPAKSANQRAFAGHAREKLFKAGDRVIHTPSGSKGVVTSVRGDGVFWKPDSRIKPGDVWVDEKNLTFDF